MDDGKIIELYFARAESAVAETDARYGAWCRAVARGILGNDQDAEECVNDAYLRVWNAVPPERPTRFRAYLGKIVRILALNRQSALIARKRGGGEATLALEELSECLPAGASPEKITEDRELVAAIDRFLAGLPAKARMIFVRRYWYMSPVRDIARDLGLKEGSVTATLCRTREKLRAFLEKEGLEL